MVISKNVPLIVKKLMFFGALSLLALLVSAFAAPTLSSAGADARPNLVLAARDIIAADVVSLAILRYGTLKAPDGLLGHYEPQPAGWLEAVSDKLKDLKWPEGKNVFRGTDSKLCDPEFSNWDWVAVQRARELGLGARGPDDLQLVFDEKDSPFAVSGEKRDWITEDALRAPKCKLNSA